MTIKFYYTPHFKTRISSEYQSKLFETIEELSPGSLHPIEGQEKISALDIMLLTKEEAYKNASYTSQMVIILYAKDLTATDANIIKDSYGPNLIAFIDTNDDMSYFKGLYSNIVASLTNNSSQAHLNEKMLTQLYQTSLNELERVKKMHSLVVPMRQERFKNISICSKFAAGLAKGGEFFDVVDHKSTITLIIGAFDSYLGTSIILKNIELLKERESVECEDIEEFLEEFTDSCRETHILDRDNYQSVQLDIIHINLKKLELETFHFGLAHLFLDGKPYQENNEFILNENNFSASYKKEKLMRGSRLVYFSPGTVLNYRKQKKNMSLFLKNFKDVAVKDFINESMYQIKSEGSKDFLDYDASIVAIEVENNAIIQM